jgi:hypothetical protein
MELLALEGVGLPVPESTARSFVFKAVFHSNRTGLSILEYGYVKVITVNLEACRGLTKLKYSPASGKSGQR